MNGAEAGSVPGSHVLVQALDGINARKLTELLVHVVGSRARVITKPDPKVLDLHRLLFMDLAKGPRTSQRPYSACLLRAAKGQLVMIHTTLTPIISPLAFLTFLSCLQWDEGRQRVAEVRNAPEEVPESGLCNDLIRSEDAHTIDFRGRLCLGREMAPDDLKFLQTHSIRIVECQ